jgi:hypothetical protein
MAGLLIIGILGASDSIAAATIEKPISGTNAAKIGRIIEINKIAAIGIDNIADRTTIGLTNHSYTISGISIDASDISDRSLIAIGNIIDLDIRDDSIDAGITNIAA